MIDARGIFKENLKGDFMKLEPLKNKIIAQPTDFTSTEPIILLKDLKSAVEWLKIYSDNPHQLLKDYPSWREGILEQLIFKTYNNWLINKAFEDVIEERRRIWYIKRMYVS